MTIVQGTGLSVQMYARASNHNTYLLAGIGDTFGQHSRSILYVNTDFVSTFVKAGAVIEPFVGFASPDGNYQFAQLVLMGHDLLHVYHTRADQTSWFYDGELLKKNELHSHLGFRATDETTIELVHV